MIISQTKFVVTCFAILFILAVTLLIAQRFGSVWAGGTGYNPSEHFEIISSENSGLTDSVQRGQVVQTGSGERLLLDMNGLTLAIDERTDVEFQMIQSGQVELYLTRGRVYIDNLNTEIGITVYSDYIRSDLIGQGRATIINYDFKDVVSLIPLEGKLIYSLDGKLVTVPAPVDVLEIAPFSETPFEFSIPGSAAEKFYEWISELTDFVF